MFWKMYNEDMIFGDITSEILPKDMRIEGLVISREKCIVAGIEYVVENLKKMRLEAQGIEDGSVAQKGEVILKIKGDARKVLSVERTVLNILSRLCGIATETKKIVEKVKKINPEVRIAATRKTLWGYLDKVAVKIGGGDTHRWNLGDMILIKDNHIKLLGLEKAIMLAKNVSFTKKIEVEVENEEDALKAAEIGVDIIMLDNFTPEKVCKTAKKLRKYNTLIEVSGGITPENVEMYAKCDIDVISMGYLTHSSKSVNLSMDVRAIP